MTQRGRPEAGMQRRMDEAGARSAAGLRRPSRVYRELEVRPAARRFSADRALIVVFACLITLPMIGMVFQLDSGFKLEENRELATLPELKWQWRELAQFPARFESYFNDRFGFRTRLIQGLNYAKVAGIGVSPTPRVILGKQDWLFYGDVDLPYYRAIEPLTHAKLQSWQRAFENRRDWLAARGIPYFIVFAPNKSTIYPEFMPDAYNRLDAPSRLDQLISHLRAHTTLTVLDLRPALREAKEREQIYYRTDTHWNQRGAYVGYAKMLEGLATWFPECQPRARSGFPEMTYVEPGRDLSLLLNLRSYYADTYVDLRPPEVRFARDVSADVPKAPAKDRQLARGADIAYENPRSRGPRAVMFRDSFGTWLIPFLADHFARIRFSWQYTMDRQIVEEERPDVVIQEMVERVLMDDPEWYVTR